MEQEYTNRHDRSVQRRIAQAKFPFTKTIEEFDFSFQPGLNQKQVIQLSASEQAKFAQAAQKGVASIVKEAESKGVPARAVISAMKN